MTHAGDIALPDVGRFSEDPCRSHTLPGSYYYAPGVFELEKRAIFNRTWQYVCHLSRVAEPGRYCVRDIGDQSVVVLRDRVEWYFPTEEPTPEQREVIEFVDVVRDEDVPICESVQRGLHSLGYTQGRLIATADRPHFSEHAVHDFQAKVLKALRAHSRAP